MLEPTGDLIFIEPIDVTEGIVLPDNTDNTKGHMFKVLAVGPGLLLDTGRRLRLDVQVGDVVALEGKVLKVPYNRTDYLIARGASIIAFDRLANGKVNGNRLFNVKK